MDKENNIDVLRKNRVVEFEKIRDDFNNIIRFISRETKDYSKMSEMVKHVDDIESYYIPSSMELASSGYYDDTLIDDELDKKCDEYREIINLCKTEMAEYYHNDIEEDDIKENTNNLVFCINDDIDLSTDNYKTGFSTTVMDLESKTSHELKGFNGGAGLERIRKNTETGSEAEFSDYLKRKFKIDCHFVPYRYRSGGDNRVGIIKFESSPAVKEYLEERYGLSKQSALYGIFMIITAGANHKQYAEFENYITKNCFAIEKLALLFTSDNPNYEELNNIVDKMLNAKKELLSIVEENKKTL